MAKKNAEIYIEYELEFLEKKLKELQTYINENPFSQLADRYSEKGQCVSNKEAQRKDLTQALKDYADILQTVDKLRENEKAKAKGRGSAIINSQMNKLMNG